MSTLIVLMVGVWIGVTLGLIIAPFLYAGRDR